jgi:hypothetical protein
MKEMKLTKNQFCKLSLIHKGIYYYQTDWNLTGLRFQNLNNQIVEYPLVNILSNKNKVWLTWIPNNQFLYKME